MGTARGRGTAWLLAVLVSLPGAVVTAAGHGAPGVLPEEGGGTMALSQSHSYEPATVGFAPGGFVVNSTLVLSNNSLEAGAFSVLNGIEPSAIAYDPAPQYVFVANAGSDTVSVIGSSGGQVLAGIHVGGAPEGLAVDPEDNLVFVANAGSNNVSVVNATTLTPFAAIAVGSDPTAAAYDAAKQEVYVADEGSDSVSVISTASPALVATIGVGEGPDGIAYDPGLGEILVSNSVAGSVSVVNDSSNSVVTTIGVGAEPGGIACDLPDEEFAVANAGSETVSIINATTDQVVGTPTVPGAPFGVVYDENRGLFYVTETSADRIAVISPHTEQVLAQVATGSGPHGIAYDPSDGTLWVADSASDAVSELSDGLQTIAMPGYQTGIAYDAAEGWTFVASGSLLVINDTMGTARGPALAILPFPLGIAYDSTLSEIYVTASKLGMLAVVRGSGTPGWFTSVPVGSGPYALAYDPGKGQMWVANSGSDNVSVIDDATNGPVASVGVGASPSGIAYDASRGEMFVTNEGSDTLSVINDTRDTVVATVPLGSSPMGASVDPQTGEVYVAEEGSAQVAIVNDTTDRVVANVSVGANPFGTLFDPGTGTVLVTNYGSATVGEINTTSERMFETVSVGSEPGFLTWDSSLGNVYVANQGSLWVNVISDALARTVASVAVGAQPTAIAYDPAAPVAAIANPPTQSLEIVANGTGTVDASIPVGSDPDAVAYSRSQGEFWVANAGSSNVSVVSAMLDRVVASVAVGSDPSAVLVDDAQGEVWVANAGSSNVSVISETRATVVDTVEVGDEPSSLALVTAQNEVWVANEGSNNVTVVSTVDDQVVGGAAAGRGPSALAVVGADEEVWAANSGSNNVSLFSSATGRALGSLDLGLAPVSLWADPGDGVVLVADSGSETVAVVSMMTDDLIGSVPVGGAPLGLGYSTTSGTALVTVPSAGALLTLLPAFAVTFQESGLPPGSPWSIRIGSEMNASESTSLALLEPNGTFPYFPQGPAGFTAAGGSINVSGAPVTAAVPFGPVEPVMYSVVFFESGLASRTPWSVTLDGSTYSSDGGRIDAMAPNGTFPYSIVPIAGYTTPSYSGHVNVSGSNSTVPVEFERSVYPVSFGQQGLPSGTYWTVDLAGGVNGTTGSTLTVFEPNGTYAYFPSATNYSAATGSVVVSGAPAARSIAFSAVTFAVRFSESGLPTRTTWSVEVGGAVWNSTSPQLVVALPNGTYRYHVLPIPNYSTLWSANFTVDGQGATVALSFAPFDWAVTFRETGLPASTQWTVTLNGTVERSFSDALVFWIPNGTYTYSVTPLGGYRTNWSGAVVVHQASLVQPVPFAVFTWPVVFAESGLAAGAHWSVTLGSAAFSSTAAEIPILEPNGSYPFVVSASGYRVTPSSGSVRIAGAPQAVDVTFASIPVFGAAFLVGTTALAVDAVVAVSVVLAFLIHRRRSRGSPPATARIAVSSLSRPEEGSARRAR